MLVSQNVLIGFLQVTQHVFLFCQRLHRLDNHVFKVKKVLFRQKRFVASIHKKQLTIFSNRLFLLRILTPHLTLMRTLLVNFFDSIKLPLLLLDNLHKGFRRNVLGLELSYDTKNMRYVVLRITHWPQFLDFTTTQNSFNQGNFLQVIYRSPPNYPMIRVGILPNQFRCKSMKSINRHLISRRPNVLPQSLPHSLGPRLSKSQRQNIPRLHIGLKKYVSDAKRQGLRLPCPRPRNHHHRPINTIDSLFLRSIQSPIRRRKRPMTPLSSTHT